MNCIELANDIMHNVAAILRCSDRELQQSMKREEQLKATPL